MKKPAKKKPDSQFPAGWNERKVRALISHYENQTETQAAAEDNAAYRNPTQTMMAVPVEFVPQVQKLIARKVG